MSFVADSDTKLNHASKVTCSPKALTPEIEELTERAEETTKEWAPPLIADRRLARIGKAAIELMDAAHYVYLALSYADEVYSEDETVPASRGQ